MFRDFFRQNHIPCLGIFSEKVTHFSGTPPFTILGEYPPRAFSFLVCPKWCTCPRMKVTQQPSVDSRTLWMCLSQVTDFSSSSILIFIAPTSPVKMSSFSNTFAEELWMSFCKSAIVGSLTLGQLAPTLRSDGAWTGSLPGYSGLTSTSSVDPILALLGWTRWLPCRMHGHGPAGLAKYLT